MATSASAIESRILPCILVVDEDAALREKLTHQLRAHGYHVTSVAGFCEALACLKQQTFDVLLADAQVEGGTGLDLVRVLREAAPTTRAILMREGASARDSQRAQDLGVVRLLSKPFEPGEMFQAVERAAGCGGGFVANVHGLSLVDLLQMLHQSRRSLTVRVLGSAAAALHLRDGQIIHAECGIQRGELALASLLKMPAGSLSTGPIEPVEQSIFRPMQAVLLDLLTRADEEERDSQTLKADGLLDDFFDSAASTGAALMLGERRESSISGQRPAVRSPEPQPVETIETACQRVVSRVDGGIACGVIDLDSNAVLGAYADPAATELAHDCAGGAAVELFRGPAVASIEALVREQQRREDQHEHHLEEIQLASKGNLYLTKVLEGGHGLIVLVTKRSTRLGMAWVELHAAIAVLERLLPRA